jgi:dCMP deaminase
VTTRWPKVKRPNKFEHYLNRAEVVSEMSTCLRRKIGAIIVSKDGVELSSGYVGSPRTTDHCIDTGICLRRELNIAPGERYELCRSVHAEQNAIINAARTGVSIVGGEMYLSSERNKEAYDGTRGEHDKIYGPCMICKKLIINSGITKVHMRERGVGVKSYDVTELKELLAQEEEKIAELLRPRDGR